MNTVFIKFIANLLPKILRLCQLRSLVNTELTILMTKIPRVLEKRSTLSLNFVIKIYLSYGVFLTFLRTPYVKFVLFNVLRQYVAQLPFCDAHFDFR